MSRFGSTVLAAPGTRGTTGRGWKLALPLLLAGVFASSLAVAGPKDDADAAIAHGVELRRAGDSAAALKEFQQARALFPSAKATAQIGLAYQALGRWAEAEAELEEGLRTAADPWIAKNRVQLRQALAAVKTHLGDVEVVGLPAGAEVFVEKRRVGVLPLPGPVRATIGTVAVEVRAPGYLPVARNVFISVGHPSRETVDLSPEPPAPKPSPVTGAAPQTPLTAVTAPPAASPSDWPRTIAWVSGAGAAVLLAGGIAALVVRSDKADQLSRRRDVDKTCTQMGDLFSGRDAQQCVDLASSTQTWTWVAAGALVGAGAAAVTATVLVVTRPRGSATAAGRGPRLAASVQPGLALVSAGWRF